MKTKLTELKLEFIFLKQRHRIDPWPHKIFMVIHPGNFYEINQGHGNDYPKMSDRRRYGPTYKKKLAKKCNESSDQKRNK